MTSLEVLVIEGYPGEGATAAGMLEAAGHHVHRCWDQHETEEGHDRVPLRDRYLCTGITRDSCPLEAGVDVALLVRGFVRPEPTARETAVTCALRDGVPVVEDGPSLLDPFAPWITARGNNDVAALCEKAAREAFDPLCAEIAERTRPLLVAADVDPDEVSAVAWVDGTRLVVRLQGPALDLQLEQALCVRALDAVGSLRRNFRQIDVGYEPNPS